MTEGKSLTTQQIEALATMRNHFSGADGEGLPMNDLTFSRYLRARQWNVSKAQSMLNDTLKWRRDFGIKSIHDGWQSIIAEENATGKGYVRGFSAAGNALLYLKPKHENTFNHDGNLKHLVYNMERAVRVMEANGRNCEKLVLIIDYDGYSLLNAPPMKTSTETLSILQNHYPERLFRAYCIRPPWIFNAFWTMISPFIDPTTYQKIVMVNGSKAEIAARLSSDGIPPEALESSLGGLDRRPFLSKVYLGLSGAGGLPLTVGLGSSSSSSNSSGGGGSPSSSTKAGYGGSVSSAASTTGASHGSGAAPSNFSVFMSSDRAGTGTGTGTGAGAGTDANLSSSSSSSHGNSAASFASVVSSASDDEESTSSGLSGLSGTGAFSAFRGLSLSSEEIFALDYCALAEAVSATPMSEKSQAGAAKGGWFW